MNDTDWKIPPSVLACLNTAPAHLPVAILLRHSVRESLPEGDIGHTLPITQAGVAIAEQLGASLGDQLSSLHSSPLTRCTQTANALRLGARQEILITTDSLLGDPGVFVQDSNEAFKNWQRLGSVGVMQHLVSENYSLPGMADPQPAAQHLVRHMLATTNNLPGVHIFVTHDLILMPTAARLLGQVLGTDDWPWYLEGAFFWQEGEQLVTVYRDQFKRQPMVALNPV